MVEELGPVAVIFGCAYGIGRTWVDALRGFELILIDREASVYTIAEQVGGVGVQVDLAKPDFWDTVGPALEGRDIGLVIFNAGLSAVAPFHQQALGQKLTQLAVNVHAPTVVAHHLIPQLRTRRSAFVLTGSMSGFQGTAWVSTYSATKAFNIALAEALMEEANDLLDVFVLVPGATRTPGFDSVTPESTRGKTMPQQPEQTVAAAMAAIKRRGPCVIVPGAVNKMVAATLRRLPRRTAARFMAGNMKKVYGGTDPDPGETR